jgi:hypothetical protein
MELEVTIDDPKAYAKAWTVKTPPCSYRIPI